MREEYARLSKTPGVIVRTDGDFKSAYAGAAKRISAEYEVPYLAHASMEPLNCTVDLHGGECDIWTGTQFQTVDRSAAARVAGLDPDKVRIHTTLAGGGFGRRANPMSDYVVEAVELAKLIGRPVKVVWTREDDTKGGYYRPMWFDRLAAGLDDKNVLTAWGHTIVGQSIMKGSPFEALFLLGAFDPASVEGAQELPYGIPHVLVDFHSPSSVVPVQWWRSVGHSHTAFVVESFIDEIASLAGIDPLQFRRSLLEPEQRQKGVSSWRRKRRAGAHRCRKDGPEVSRSTNPSAATSPR